MLFRSEIALAAADGGARDAGDPRHGRHAAPARRPRLGSREKTLAALIEMATKGFPTISNGGFVDHATLLRLFSENRNRGALSQSDAGAPDFDSIILRGALSTSVLHCHSAPECELSEQSPLADFPFWE